MPLAENDGIESPVEGKGDEMLPERGIPFEGVDDDSVDLSETDVSDIEIDGELTEDLSSDEIATIFGDGEALGFEDEITEGNAIEDITEGGDLPGDSEIYDIDSEAGNDAYIDGGMGASEPILTDEDLPPEDGISGIEFVLPAEESVVGMPSFMDPDVVPSHPRDEVPQVSEGLEPSDEMLNLLVNNDRLKILWDRIDKIQSEVYLKVPGKIIARQIIAQIEKARNEILAGRDHYEEAERALGEAELRIAITERAVEENKFALYLFLYEIIWAVILVLGWVFIAQPAIQFILSMVTSPIASESSSLARDLHLAMNCMIWGGLGGIVGAVYALWRHTSRDMDFSKQYYMWYLANPFMGMFIGVLIFLLVRASLISMVGMNEQISSPFIIYVLALLVGYQQNVAYELMRRLLNVFRFSRDQDRTEETVNASE
jgi:hypothetical protein